MSLLEQYEIELLIEIVMDLKRLHIQGEMYVFYDMCEMHQNTVLKSLIVR